MDKLSHRREKKHYLIKIRAEGIKSKITRCKEITKFNMALSIRTADIQE